LVVVDDFSRYTWVILLWEKSDALDVAQQLFKKIQIEQNCPIMRIRSDHGREFKNTKFEEFCLSYGIQQEFSSPITPHQNGVVERKNRMIQEMARVIIHSKNLAQHFWGEADNTACHIINRVYLRPETNKTPYEIWRGKKPTVKYFRTFGSRCYILRDRKNLGKFDLKTDEGIFLGYSTNSCAYRVFNKRTETMMESINVIIDDEEIEASSKGWKFSPFLQSCLFLQLI
jgi:transposase InsO family protein